jgi:hypothetical protein
MDAMAPQCYGGVYQRGSLSSCQIPELLLEWIGVVTRAGRFKENSQLSPEAAAGPPGNSPLLGLLVPNKRAGNGLAVEGEQEMSTNLLDRVAAEARPTPRESAILARFWADAEKAVAAERAVAERRRAEAIKDPGETVRFALD